MPDPINPYSGVPESQQGGGYADDKFTQYSEAHLDYYKRLWAKQGEQK